MQKSQKSAMLYYLPDCEIIGIEEYDICIFAGLQRAVIINDAKSSCGVRSRTGDR